MEQDRVRGSPRVELAATERNWDPWRQARVLVSIGGSGLSFPLSAYLFLFARLSLLFEEGLRE